jgi:ABC-type uncharacterized transport system permease subunit
MGKAPHKKWFTRKLYGYGWTPASWQGWFTLLIFIGFNVWNFLRIDTQSHSVSDTLINFILPFVLTTIILIYLCVAKGEKARWQWGQRLED